MYPVPLTYDFVFKNPDARPWLMAELADAGVKHLVLSVGLINQIMQDASQLNAIERDMKNAGLDFVDAHSPFCLEADMSLLETSQRGIMIARHKLSLEIAAYFNVSTITIHVGNNHTQALAPFPLQQHLDMISDALAQLLPTAEKLGITICIENIWTQVNTPEQLLAWKKQFPTDALGFCFDSGHANLMSSNGSQFPHGDAALSWQYNTPDIPPWDDAIADKMQPHIVNCHLHDNIGEYDRHLLPGDGCINWQDIREKLMAAPRLKCIQSEVAPIHNRIPLKKLVSKFEELFPECKDL